jgi:phosphodiesterase/alkaline phosphatase D-like protein
VWIRVDDHPSTWRLLIEGRDPVAFEATDPSHNEFGTGIAHIDGLEATTAYHYSVARAGSGVARASGVIRTMPDDDSDEPIRFVTLSCNDDREPSAWHILSEYVERERPHFVLMIGDQIYTDEGEEDLWEKYKDRPGPDRRQAIAAKHQKVWAHKATAWVMANVPVYMTWDDHDIRDGWGSFAGDSAALAEEYPESAQIYERYRSYFDDCYDAFWHFQAVHNPPVRLQGGSKALPFAFRAGRLLVVTPDLRTERDFAREEMSILGADQWRFIEDAISKAGTGVGAYAVATSVPIVDLSPDSKVHRLYRGRSEDIDLFKAGDKDGLEALRYQKDNPLAVIASVMGAVDPSFQVARKLGFRVSELDDVRDKWSYEGNLAEQDRLLRLFFDACSPSRAVPGGRNVCFLGGDIHVGALLEIEDRESQFTATSVVTSGIAKSAPLPEVIGVLIDRDFDTSERFHVHLNEVINAVNFAITTVTFEGGRPQFEHDIVYLDGDGTEQHLSEQSNA